MYSSTLGYYGYASSLFYGDLFMYPFALLNAIGVDILISYKLMCLCLWAAIFISAGFSMRRICKSQQATDIAIFVYMVLGVCYSNVAGAAIGRAVACIFIPIAILGIYQILESPGRLDWIYLAVGVAGTVCFQVIDGVICVTVLALIFLASIRKVRLIHIWKIVKAIALCLLLSAWFVLPMLEQLADNTFFVTSSDVPLGKTSIGNYTIPLIGWFFPRKVVYVIARLLGNEYLQSHLYGFGYLAMAVGAVVLIKAGKKVMSNGFYIAMFITIIFSVWFQTRLFPHDAVQSLIGVMQFPWRLATVGTLALAIVSGKLYLAEAGRWKKLTLAILVVTTWCGMLVFVSSVGWHLGLMIFSDGYSETVYDFDSYSIGSAEYLPEQLYVYDADNTAAYKDYLLERGDTVVSDNEGISTQCARDGCKTIIEYSENDSVAILELPLVMYKGYYAVDLETEEEVPVSISEHGLVQIEVSNAFGEVAVWYKGTTLQSVSYIFSGISFAMLVVYVFLLRKRKGRATV